LTIPAAAAEFVDESPGPLSPAAELATMHLADDALTVELVAAEPAIESPVACAWDERGRLYVAEMRDYPTGPPAGRIKQLVDRDGDGRYEEARLFAEGLHFPNGVLPWREGLLVTAAPDILYLQDHDDDGRAEARQVMLTGFGEGNQQLRVNGLLWGLDGWVYGANGRSDGAIRRPTDAASQAVSLRRHDFRFQPDTGRFETTAGPSQFGLARDDWGNRFLSWNTNPLRHVVIEQWYLARNPHLAAAGSEPLIDVTTSGRLYPRSRPPQTFNKESVRHFNASCGITIYRGDWLPAEYDGNALVCEPLTNLVHRRVLRSVGATFTAVRPEREQQQEFLAATDPWFHPVNLATGPDGALYVVDFYRKWVEHPQFVPEYLRADVDFRSGAEHGRIWRIRPRSQPRRSASPVLAGATTAQLVELLEHPNGWHRDTAQRLLTQRRDAGAARLVGELLRAARSPQGCVCALWTLHLLDAVDAGQIAAALANPSARVREQALRLAEMHWPMQDDFLAAANALIDDSDARVRLQLVLSLGSFPGRLDLLTALAEREPPDQWRRLALLSSLHNQEAAFLAELSRRPCWTDARYRPLIREVAQILGARNREDELSACLALNDASHAPRLALFAGLARGLEQAGTSLAARLSAIKPGALDAVVQSGCSIALDSTSDQEDRLLAIDVFSLAPGNSVRRAVLALLDPRQPRTIQVRAAQVIGQRNDAALAAEALSRWQTLSLAARRELLSACCRTPTLAALLLSAMEAGRLAAADFDFIQRDALLAVIDERNRQRAQAHFADRQSADRGAVARQYDAALDRGDRRRGAQVFADNCAVCHQVAGFGARVGPELSGVGSRSPAVLLIDILDPSREIAPDFLAYLVETTDGQLLTGLIAGETAAAITLRGPEAVETIVPRERIAQVQSTGKSLMPDGLEQKISPRQMADLLAFLGQPDRDLLPAKQ
jgi:putative membrane-bound dehydrogenase-like protein